MGFFGARQGHLEIAGLGEARQARALDLRRDLHRAWRGASAEPFHRSRRSSISSITGSTCRAFPRRLLHGRRATDRAKPSPSSRSVGWSRRRATICCSTRWRRLPAALKWRFIHIGGGDLSQQLKERAQKLGLSEQIEWRGSTRPERGHRRPARSRHLRAALPHRQRRRPRRPAQCPDGGRKPGTAHPVDQCLVHSGVHRKRQARRPRRARCRTARRCARKNDRRPGRPRKVGCRRAQTAGRKLRHGRRHRPAGLHGWKMPLVR